MQLLFPLLVVAFLVAAILLLSRSGVLFRISIRGGKVAVVSGYVPGALLDDFAGAVRHVTRGEIRAHKSGGYVNLSFSGDVDDVAAQRLRNILGLYPSARLRAPQRKTRPSTSTPASRI